MRTNVWVIGGALLLFSLWMAEVDWRWLAAGSVAWVAWTFNLLVSLGNAAREAYSSVEVMLKKRYDVIPSLVDTVQRYMEHESDVLEEVVRLRAEAVSGSATPERAAELDRQTGIAVSRILATAESYPELKANESFQQLQAAINEAEAQIAAARRAYNATVADHNDAVRMFPTNVFARLAGLRERSFFEAHEAVHERPDVRARFDSARRD